VRKKCENTRQTKEKKHSDTVPHMTNQSSQLSFRSEEHTPSEDQESRRIRRSGVEMFQLRGSDKVLIFIYIGSMLGIMMLGTLVRTTDAALTFDKLFLHYKNDFHACYPESTEYNFALTDDGTCRELYPANNETGLEACYYQSYLDGATRKLALITRCDCEYVTNHNGHRAYNRSCNLLRMQETECVDLSGRKKGTVFNTFFNTSTWLRYINAETSP